MAIGLKKIKGLSKKGSPSNVEKEEVNTRVSVRPWQEMKKEDDLLTIIANNKNPQKKRNIKKEFKKSSGSLEKKIQKEKELLVNKRPGISNELQEKLKDLAQRFFIDDDSI